MGCDQRMRVLFRRSFPSATFQASDACEEEREMRANLRCALHKMSGVDLGNNLDEIAALCAAVDIVVVARAARQGGEVSASL